LPISDGVMRLSASQLAALVDGLDWSLFTRATLQRRRRRREACAKPLISLHKHEQI
jgi:hypothetical protein